LIDFSLALAHMATEAQVPTTEQPKAETTAAAAAYPAGAVPAQYYYPQAGAYPSVGGVGAPGAYASYGVYPGVAGAEAGAPGATSATYPAYSAYGGYDPSAYQYGGYGYPTSYQYGAAPGKKAFKKKSCC